MTLQEAKIADDVLEQFIIITEKEKMPLYNIMKALKIDFDNDIILNKYVPLLIADGFFNKEMKKQQEQMIRVISPVFSVSHLGISFKTFKGGYTKMVEEKIEKERREKNKYRFDIGKDIVLILLAIGTLLISYFGS